MNFYIECPKFGEDFTNTESKMDYAHPVDAQIIKFLNNGIINSLCKQLVEILSDSTYGTLLASGVPVTETTYPDINKIIEECVQELNIKRPYVVISSGIPGITAMVVGSDEEPYLMLSPLMVNTMKTEQLKFVIGHECAHIAMGHLVYHSIVSIGTTFASAIPVIGDVLKAVGLFPLMAWSRRSEISADRAGLLCCGDCEVAKRTLLQIALPFMDADKIDIEDYVNNSKNYLHKGIIRKLNEFDDAHPIMPKRIQALEEFVKSNKYHKLMYGMDSTDGISDAELERRTENIIKVL